MNRLFLYKGPTGRRVRVWSQRATRSIIKAEASGRSVEVFDQIAPGEWTNLAPSATETPHTQAFKNKMIFRRWIYNLIGADVPHFYN